MKTPLAALGAVTTALLAAFALILTGQHLTVTAAAATSTGPDVERTSCNVDATGYCVVPHHLGVVPKAVLVSADTPQNFNAFILNTQHDSYTASTFTLRAMYNQTTPKINTTIWFTFEAFPPDPVTPPPSSSATSATPPSSTGTATSSSSASTTSTTPAGPTPVFADEFNGTSVDTAHWGIYDGLQASSGETWSAGAWSVANGVLTGATGADGVIPGMASTLDRVGGDWQVRAKLSAPADPNLAPVFLLWPQNDSDWPAAGEIDFTENYDPARQYTEGWLHYDASNDQDYAGEHAVDMTQWHTYEVKWVPPSAGSTGSVQYLIDGVVWFNDTTAGHIPAGPMHLALQMNNNADVKTGRTPTSFQVDWVHVYS